MNPLTELISTSEFKYITLAHDRFIAPSLKYYGEYCTEEIDLISQFLKPDSIVMDIGANIGTHTLAMAKLVPDGEVWSFEPQKFVHQILSGNIALNSFTHVRAFHCAVGKENGQIGVPLIDYNTWDNYGGLDLRKYGGGDADQYDMTPLITLDSLQLQALDLMKIDVDGMEEDVLRGGFKTVFQCQPIIYIEADREEQRPGLIGFLSTLGYRIWQHEPALVNRKTEMKVQPDANMDKDAHKNLLEMKNYKAINLICVPKEAQVLPQEMVTKFNLRPILM